MTAKRPVRGHTEASTIAFTEFVLDGVGWHLTLREGATAETTLVLLAECHKVQQALAAAGAVFVLGRDAREKLQRQAAPRPIGGNGAGRGNGHSAPQSDAATTTSASSLPTHISPPKGGPKAIVRTAAWATATASLASRYPSFRREDGRPDWHAMTRLAAEAGFREITDENLVQVAAVLEEAAVHQAVTA